MKIKIPIKVAPEKDAGIDPVHASGGTDAVTIDAKTEVIVTEMIGTEMIVIVMIGIGTLESETRELSKVSAEIICHIFFNIAFQLSSNTFSRKLMLRFNFRKCQFYAENLSIYGASWFNAKFDSA